MPLRGMETQAAGILSAALCFNYGENTRKGGLFVGKLFNSAAAKRPCVVFSLLLPERKSGEKMSPTVKIRAWSARIMRHALP